MKTPIYKKAVLSLSLIFCLQAGNALANEEPFSQIFGEDYTTEEYSHNGKAGMFWKNTTVSMSAVDYLKNLANQKQKPDYTETIASFVDDVNKYIDSKEKEAGHILSRKEKIFAIDDYINNFLEYQKDPITYKMKEYYATAYESIKNEKGDCDDHAILKYEVLKRLGFPEDHMRLAHSPKHMSLLVKIDHYIYQLDNAPHRSKTIIGHRHGINEISGLTTLDYDGMDLIVDTYKKFLERVSKFNLKQQKEILSSNELPKKSPKP